MEKTVERKTNAIAIFWDEFTRSNILVIFLAILSGIILGGVLVALTTAEVYDAFAVSFWKGIGAALKTAWDTYVSLFTGAVGNPAKISAAFSGGDPAEIRRAINPFFESLVQTTPYIFGGLAVALGFRAGMFNIGVEGQLFMGAVTGAWAGYAITGLPAVIHIPLAMLFGAMGGALWGFVPGFLKAKTGAHEVIVTIMMNYTAFRLVDWLLKFPMKDPNEYTPKTPWIQPSAELPRFFEAPVRFHLGFFIALAFAWLIWWILFKTTWGLNLRTVGTNPRAAKYAGLSVTKSIIVGMAISGGLAGLAGANQILAVNRSMALGLSSGYGFDSIALALIGGNHPVGVVLASILFGTLRNGATRMMVVSRIPIDIVDVVQAIILMFVAAP
ncbi:MAG TPA: ABC transporter permease, partial [Anaerolineaceae bacterium]|nr:ABC transporter permease [Anaerolineaceae bacterium]